MRHQDCTQNHILESWVYANAAARNGATGMLAADIGRIAFQTDTGQYWRLISNSPVTWQAITGAPATVNAVNSTPANPTGTTSLTGAMMGLAVAFTPVNSGKVSVSASGSMANSAAASGMKPQIRYGTGTPPGSAGSPVGTAVGNQPQANNLGANVRVPFTCTAIISGLPLGVAHWFDVVLAAITGGTANVYDLSITVVELG